MNKGILPHGGHAAQRQPQITYHLSGTDEQGGRWAVSSRDFVAIAALQAQIGGMLRPRRSTPESLPVQNQDAISSQFTGFLARLVDRIRSGLGRA